MSLSHLAGPTPVRTEVPWSSPSPVEPVEHSIATQVCSLVPQVDISSVNSYLSQSDEVVSSRQLELESSPQFLSWRAKTEDITGYFEWSQGNGRFRIHGNSVSTVGDELRKYLRFVHENKITTTGTPNPITVYTPASDSNILAFDVGPGDFRSIASGTASIYVYVLTIIIPFLVAYLVAI